MQKIKRTPTHAELMSVESPVRYVGGEWGVIYKDDVIDSLEATGETDSVRFAFCFPDIYEMGMSNVALKILYHILNKIPYVYCERAFSPWKDMDAIMRETQMGLYTLETKSVLSEFDVIGFTLQYEMCYTNVLQMLDLGGVPLRSCERGQTDPIVIAGGPVVYNAEPVAPFFDAIILGEGEEVLAEMMGLIKAYKDKKRAGKDVSRKALLLDLSSIEGVYVPSLYEVTYLSDGAVERIAPISDKVPQRIKKRIIKDLNHVDYPTNPIVPHTKIIHDRSYLELFRGCIRGCRFCQAGYIYRPVRERSVDQLCEQAFELEKNTGYDEMGLLSLSTSDYSQLHELADRLVEPFSSRHTSLSLPSLRLDSFSMDLMEKVSDTRKTGLTFAPEAGTQRLRDVINKGITEEDIMSSARLAFAGGWTRVKLYFMLGLPTETMEDVLGIADIANKIERLYHEVVRSEGLKPRRPEIVVSTSMFIPKPFTPFQWEKQDDVKDLEEKQKILSQALKSRNIKYSWHDLDSSVWEAILSRGDRRLADVLIDGYKSGLIFDAWGDCFDYDRWIQILEKHDLKTSFYANRSREKEEIFPWSHIDVGVKDSFLWKERQNALAEKLTPHCRLQCSACGVEKFQAGVCYASK